jgi:hypothetical protein
LAAGMLAPDAVNAQASSRVKRQYWNEGDRIFTRNYISRAIKQAITPPRKSRVKAKGAARALIIC